jgi:hypothetical protein
MDSSRSGRNSGFLAVIIYRYRKSPLSEAGISFDYIDPENYTPRNKR